MSSIRVKLTVNGQPAEAVVPAEYRLIDLLRGPLGLTGTKLGCGQGNCGACTVLVDGAAVNSCLMLAGQASGRDVRTVEGLAGTALHPIQQAMVDAGAAPCGFCGPGMLMSAAGLLQHQPHPSRQQIREALAGNLCRCSAHDNIINAVAHAAESREKHHG